MVISEERKFIFIAVSKTGTTSIESILKKYGTCYGENLKNLSSIPNAIPKHASIHSLERDYGIDTGNYFCFGFVRNPWLRTFSWYKYVSRLPKSSPRSSKGMSFEEFIEKRENVWATTTFGNGKRGIPNTGPQLGMLIDPSEKLKVDFVARVENMQEDFDKICDKLGIPKTKIPHLNRSGKDVPSDVWTKKLIDKVHEKLEKEISYFNYELVLK